MMKKFAHQWVNYMIDNGAREDQRAVYIYGMECFLNELVSNAVLLVCAGLLHRVWEMLIWISAFTILRVNAGGAHASSHFKCIVLSTLTGCISVIIYPVFLGRPLLTFGCTAAALLIVWLYAPVVHKNHPVSEKRRKSARIWAVRIAFAEAVAVLVFYITVPFLAAVILVGLLSAVIMLLFALFPELKYNKSK